MRRLHDIGLERQDQGVAVVERAGGLHPAAVLGEHVRRQSGQHVVRGQERRLLLDDAMNGEIAGGKLQPHGDSLALVFERSGVRFA
ncbi:hypothetical protein [Bradyrhizobium elkanii]